MKTLILETSGPESLIALCEGKKIIKSHLLSGSQGLSSRLHPALENLLEGQDFNAIAVGIGPGSYAGSRTAAAIAKTLGYALKKPLLSFPSPLAFIPLQVSGNFAYLADAKMGQIALFKGPEMESFALLNREELDLSGFDFVVAEEKCRFSPDWLSPTPNPAFVAAYIYKKIESGQFCRAEELKLTYFR